MSAERKEKIKKIAVKTAVAALWLALWQLVCMAVNMELLVVSPWRVAKRLWALSLTWEFWRTALGSLGRITEGFVLGSATGAILAMLCHKFTFAREFFSPAITLIKSTPVASFIILALVWLTGQRVPVFIAFLMVLPVVYGNVFQGIREVDPKLLEMAKVYGMNRQKRVMKITIPSVLPYMMAACRTALGLSWKAGVAAEVIGVTKDSIGRQLYYSKIYLETADLFAWTAVVIILSIVLEKCFVRAVNGLSQKLHLVRADSPSPRERMAPSDDLPEEAKAAGNPLSIQEDSGKKWREGRQPDACGEIPNSLAGGMSMTLRLTNVSKAFGEKQVLKDFSLTAREGERVCLLGPSGGGKTTLLNIVAGLLPPDSGERELPAGRISYIFQEYRLLPWLTAEENITEATGCTKERAREMLQAVELLSERRGYPDDFSGGMKQRLNIARALARDSKLILMDEPFKGLDPELRERVIDRVNDCCENRTVLLVTHDKAESDLLHCTRMLTLEGMM